MGTELILALPEMDNFLKSDKQVDDSEPNDRYFEIGAEQNRPKTGVAIQKIVIVPKIQPREKHQPASGGHPVGDMDKGVDERQDFAHPFQRAVRGRRIAVLDTGIRRAVRNAKGHAVRDRSSVHQFAGQHHGIPDLSRIS